MPPAVAATLGGRPPVLVACGYFARAAVSGKLEAVFPAMIDPRIVKLPETVIPPYPVEPMWLSVTVLPVIVMLPRSASPPPKA